MVEFLKSVSNLIIISVTILGFITLLIKLPFQTTLIGLLLFLFIGFILLILYYFSRLENKINSIGQKFKRADSLIDIKKDIETLKLIILKRK